MRAGLNLPPFNGTAKALSIAAVAVFVVDTLLRLVQGLSLANILGLSGRWFFQGHIYQLLTYPWISTGPLELLFNVLLLWFLGGELESLWGRKRYLIYLAASGVGAGILYLILGVVLVGAHPLPLTGMTGLSNALLLAYAVLFPDRPLSFFAIFPLPAKYFCMILIALQVYSGLASPMGHQAWGHLGAMACGYACMLIMVRQGQRARTPGKSSKGARSHLKLVGDEKKNDDGTPKMWH